MTPYFDDGQVTLLHGDVRERLREMPAESVNCTVTSPPYWGLRDYGVDGQLGLESTPEEYVANMVAVFREVRRVLRDDGTLWLNIGDSYGGSGRGGNPTVDTSTLEGSLASQEASIPARTRLPVGKPKDLIGIPWRLAFALQADGWWLRQDIIWSKPNPMPESVRDRCTKAHEYLFLLSKNERYWSDFGAIREPAGYPSDRPQNSFAREQPDIPLQKHGGSQGNGYMEYPEDSRNRRSVWHIPTAPFPEAHFATFPPALVEPCILAGCPEGGIVLDPFIGSGTTAMVARQLGRRAVGIDLNEEYLEMAVRRIGAQMALIGGEA